MQPMSQVCFHTDSGSIGKLHFVPPFLAIGSDFIGSLAASDKKNSKLRLLVSHLLAK